MKIYFALPSILCFLLSGLPPEKSPENSRVPVIVHRRIGSTACELVQRGSLMAQRQEFAWLEIDGTNGEIYSPELGPYDYLTPTLSLPGAIAKTARKSGFELKASSTTSSDMPGVAALSGGANCPDLPSAIDETEKERTSRREQLQSKIYGPLSEGVTPVHVNNTPPKSEQVSVDPPKNDTGTQSKNKQLQGTVILAVVIGADGSIRGMRVKQSVSPELDQKAAEVLSRWTYNPARLKGLPVPMEMMMEVNFHLH
jgi:TonB family protein